MQQYSSNDLEQSLNYFIRNGFQPHPYFYNCTGVDGDKLGQKRPYLGTYFITMGTILLMIYIPCLIVIARSDLMKSSCYKIMLFLGFLDIACILSNSITTGFLGFIGSTFCSYPRIIFIMGSVGCGCWMGSCCACVILAINRCCDVNHHLPIRVIFIGNKVYFTMALPIIYTIYSLFFTKPIIFNSNYFSWFFNPMISGHSPLDYINIAHTINNCIVSGTTTCLYTYLCILLFHKNRYVQSVSISKTQRQIFFQSVMICSFNAIAAYIYVYMQFFYSPPEIILIGQIAWQFAHGSVGIIYITMNKTVRRGVIDMICPSVIRNKTRIGTYLFKPTKRPILSIVIGSGPLKQGGMMTKQTTSSGTVF